MSAPVWRRRRRHRYRPTAADLRAVQKVLDRGGSHNDVVRVVLPHASDRVCAFILWELTPFPMLEDASVLPYIREAVRRAR